MNLSVIIPTFNEEENLTSLLPFLKAIQAKTPFEILVIDGGSTDKTLAIAQKNGIKAFCSPQKGRAAQMNFGAAQAQGEVLQFLHADTVPPPSFVQDIAAALAEGYPAGCFTYRFRSKSVRLKVNAYFTQFDRLWCRGGDQAIFLTRHLFEELGGYPDFLIMEEYELLKKLQKIYPFKIIKKNALVSARKYDKNGYWRVQIANFVVFNMYRFGYSQQKMVDFYRSFLS